MDTAALRTGMYARQFFRYKYLLFVRQSTSHLLQPLFLYFNERKYIMYPYMIQHHLFDAYEALSHKFI